MTSDQGERRTTTSPARHGYPPMPWNRPRTVERHGECKRAVAGSYEINLINSIPEPSTLAMAPTAAAVGIRCAARRHSGAVSFGRWGG